MRRRESNPLKNVQVLAFFKRLKFRFGRIIVAVIDFFSSDKKCGYALIIGLSFNYFNIDDLMY